MKRMLFFAVLFFGLISFTALFSQTWHESTDFLTTAVACGTSTTLVNGTGFNSSTIRVARGGYPEAGAITITFTRTTGSASEVYFEFQASYDNGTTWTTAYYVRIAVATNETAVSNVVVKTTLINLNGVSHLRLYRIVNLDAAVGLTACNANFSI